MAIINQYLEQMNSSNRMLSSISTDLKVIGTYLQTSLEPKVQPRNLSQLSSLVKNRLSEKLVSKEKKNNCREWLENKGMNIQPLLQYISNRNKRQKNQDKSDKIQETLGKAVLQPTLFNHEAYSQKAIQYASTNVLKYVQTNRSMNKRHFKNAMLKLHCETIESSQSHVRPISFRSTIRNEQKRSIYIKTVKKLLELESQQTNDIYDGVGIMQNDKAANLFCENITHKIWSVLYRQVRNVDFSRRKQVIMTEILLNSLSLVEEEFNQELPLTKQALNYYLQQRYLNQVDKNGQYEFDQEHGSIWGKIFLFFRAGRRKEVLNLLKDVRQRELVQQIKLNYQSIDRKNPKKAIINSFVTRITQDIFRDQILFAIGGQRKYSSQLLADTTTLDCVWVLLRNTGIYYQTDSELFQQMKAQMVQYYRQSHQEKQQIYNCAYLLDYESICKMSESEILDKDDILHLLIVLQRYPSLINQKQLIQQRLTELAVNYAVELAQENRKELVYYILMIPQERIVEEASSIIAGNKLYLRFDWSQIKKYLRRQELFTELVSQTSKKFVISTRNFLEAAMNLSNHNGDKETALNLLTEMFVIHYEEKKIYDQQEISRALHFFSCLVKQSSQLGKNYFQLNQLFECLNSLSKASRNRNYHFIDNVVKNTSLVFAENIDYYNAKMLDKLMELGGLDVYFIFLANISRAADYIFKTGDQQELKQFNYMLFRTANTVFNHNKYNPMCLEQNITKLMAELGEKVMESAVQDYKSYY